MIITCPSCSARFNVKSGEIGAEGRSVRCSRCGHTWRALPAGDQPLDLADPLPEAPLPSAPAPATPVSPPPAAPQKAPPLTATAAAPIVATPVVVTPSTAASAPPEGPLLGGARGPGRVLEPRPVLEPRGGPDSRTVPGRDAGAPRRTEPRYERPPLKDPPLADDEALFKNNGEKKRGNGWGATLLLIVLLFGALAAAGWFWRNDIVAEVPELAKIYEAIGVPVAQSPAPTLSIESVTFMPQLDAGVRKLLVSGLLRNPSDRVLAVPTLTIRVLDQAGQTLTSWTYQPPQTTLAPGNSLRFESLHDQPDYSGTLNVDVSVAP